MTRATRAATLVLVGLSSISVGMAGREGLASRAQAPPFRTGSGEPLDFRGPGREEPEPDVPEVVLGWFGPGSPDDPAYGAMWRGALVALDEENAAGGYRRRPGAGSSSASGSAPFRLAPAWSENPWQAGIVDLVRLVYEAGAWAVIGGVDGTSTHLAVQVALKSHVLLLSPGSSDVTADGANVPWLFSLPPSDEAVAPVVVGALPGDAAAGGLAIVASTDHATHATLVAFRRELARRRIGPAVLVEIGPSGDDTAAAVAHVRQAHPCAVLVLAPAPEAGRIVVALRSAGVAGPILGGVTASSAAFREAAGDAAEGVLAPVAVERGAAWETFAAAYEQRWRAAPDAAATDAYDAVRLVVAAVRKAGLNRARIRDAVRALDGWSGAGAPIRWNALGRNEPCLAIGRWSEGRLRRLGPETAPGSGTSCAPAGESNESLTPAGRGPSSPR